jgi:predicted ester cyclase
MGTEENRQAVLDAMAAFTRGDMERYLSLYDPSVRLHGYTPEPLDYDGVVAFYASFGQSFTNASLTSNMTVAEGELVCTQFTLEADHTGEFQGVPATGTRVRADGCTVLRFAGGACVERWATFDFLGVLVQIGAIPAPTTA